MLGLVWPAISYGRALIARVPAEDADIDAPDRASFITQFEHLEDVTKHFVTDEVGQPGRLKLVKFGRPPYRFETDDPMEPNPQVERLRDKIKATVLANEAYFSAGAYDFTGFVPGIEKLHDEYSVVRRDEAPFLPERTPR